MHPAPGALGPTCDQIIRGKLCDGLPERYATIPDQITFAGPGVHRASDGKTYTITYEKEVEHGETRHSTRSDAGE